MTRAPAWPRLRTTPRPLTLAPTTTAAGTVGGFTRVVSDTWASDQIRSQTSETKDDESRSVRVAVDEAYTAPCRPWRRGGGVSGARRVAARGPGRRSGGA